MQHTVGRNENEVYFCRDRVYHRMTSKKKPNEKGKEKAKPPIPVKKRDTLSNNNRC